MPKNAAEQHTLSLSLSPRIKRREVLGFLSGATVAALAGCQRQLATESAETVSSALPTCIVRPEQTEGPYFVQEALNRSDIREGKAGVPLRMVLRVLQVSARACVPLEGAVVDIWHCDAQGAYSGVADRSFDTAGQNFLRGSQLSGADGTVEFITVYPGWYPGRTVHIHFKIRSTENSQGYEFTSQLYFDDELNDRVGAQTPYSSRGQQGIRNKQDRIYQNGGQQLMLGLTPDEEGYTGVFDIGLEIG